MYADYFWENGLPVGVQGGKGDSTYSYKITSDPYKRKVTVEKYKDEVFDTILYDSTLLDFRKLHPKDQVGWEHKPLTSSKEVTKSIIRDENDAVKIIETYEFDNSVCRQCLLHSPHAILLGTQKMYYTAMGDPCDGVALYDLEGRPVMFKRYSLDSDGNFLQVEQELWAFSPGIRENNLFQTLAPEKA